MKILVVIWTYHRSVFSLFLLIFAYFCLLLLIFVYFCFFSFSMINCDYKWFHVVRYVFCFQYIFFMMMIVLLRVYPVLELSFSGTILFRMNPFQELSFSGTTLFRMNPFQELSFSGIILFRNYFLQNDSFSGRILIRKFPCQEQSLSGIFLLGNNPFQDFFFRKHDSMITFCWFANIYIYISIMSIFIVYIVIFFLTCLRWWSLNFLKNIFTL